MRGVLSVGDGDTECADSGSGCTRRVGCSGVRNDECGIGRSDFMGNQYVVAVLSMVFYKKKTKINTFK